LVGTILNRRLAPDGGGRDYRGIFVSSTLGLLSLVIGFTLSMAVGRYDLRKSYEAHEANAISTEYVRIDLLAGDREANLRALMSNYLNERIRFYVSRDENDLPQIARRTAELQTAMWDAVRAPANAQRNAVDALVVAGMNEVLDDQGYTQAAWRNRLPIETWVLMLAIALFANLFIGFSKPPAVSRFGAVTTMPLIISIAFMLIGDIDSPRGGFVNIEPHNLLEVAHELKSSPGNRSNPTAARTLQLPHG
jgi:hypothetical protein